MTKRIMVRGPLLTHSGYGVHARQIVRWAFEQADIRNDLEVCTEPLPWGNTPWYVDTQDLEGLVGRIIQNAQPKDHYDVSLQIQLPNEWNSLLADYNVGITAGVETDKCNPAWVTAINNMDLVIVPSEFTKKTFMNSGEIKTRIEVVPEAFSDAILETNLPEIPLKLETSFNFLVFGQITGNNPENDRKNIFYTIKWMNEVFADQKDVGIILKSNMSRNTVLDRIQLTNILSQVQTETRKGAGPRLYLLHGDMKETEVAALYRHPKIKAFVTLTHAEGFGLPILEAAASGMPVIATNWSAHPEFLNAGKFIKLDYKLGPVHESRIDNNIFMKDVQWAFPLEDDVKRKLKKFKESPSTPAQWARDLASSLKKTHSFEAIKAHYSKLLEDTIK